MRRLLAAGFLAACSAPCLADTPFSVDVSDLWIDPNESGWGINLAQQGDMVFATLFVYGPDGKPRWYSASSMKGARSGSDVTFNGALAESSGPPQPGAFDASRVTRREVGAITFQTHGNNRADLTYTVNGTRVTKAVQRFTMAATDSSGLYASDMPLGCTSANSPTWPASLHIVQSPGAFSLDASASTSSCTYTGTPQWHGRILDVAGTFSCNFGWQGTFELTNVNVTYQGFVGHLRQSGMNCTREMHVGGIANEGTKAARASVDVSDLWWNPGESGWGMNFQHHDNQLFGTLFTYGAAGQSKWYSASDLRVSFVAGGGLPSFDGGLYESTGPSFSTAFNAASVTRRRVGDFHASPIPGTPDQMDLSWSVDGVSYAKRVMRFTTIGNQASGTYRGNFSATNACRLSTNTTSQPLFMVVTQQPGSLSLETFEPNQDCRYRGSLEVHGRMLGSSGTYTCTGNSEENGTFVLSEMEVGLDGLIGQLTRTAANTVGSGVGCTKTGRILGLRPAD